MGFLINFLARVVQWFHDFVLWLALHVWKLCLAGISDLINAIPAPSFFSNVAGYISGIPPTVAYFLAGMNISAGFTIVLTAYSLRFLIRRIFFIN